MLRATALISLACGLREDSSRLMTELARDQDGYAVDSKPCEEPQGSHFCKASVEEQLRQLEGLEDVSSRIGAVLAAQDANFDSCCSSGTDFDEFVFASTKGLDMRSAGSPIFNATTALVIIDIQQDFTVGSFSQPCWGKGGPTFLKKLFALAKMAADAGATIIASKDLHPSNHCSFGGEDHCKNQKDQHEGTSSARYVNDFPSHCSFEMQEGKVVPQKAPDTPFCQLMKAIEAEVPLCAMADFVGADFDPALEEALGALPKEQVEVVYKGVYSEYDSFSAMEHREGSGKAKNLESHRTGGWAMPITRDDECHGKWKNLDCYPRKEELFGEGKRSFADILNERKISKMVVVGLVYDYCVKETAIFTKENSPDMEVMVLADLTRPSFDGKPGAPYSPNICDGKEEARGFCAEGGGTKTMYKKVLDDFRGNGVEVRRLTEPSCVENGTAEAKQA